MNPTFEHGGVSSYCGDNRAILAALPEKSVQTCVTSPPYFGLRAYGTSPQIWGGDTKCEHNWQSASFARRANDGGSDGRLQTGNAGSIGRDVPILHASCTKCGAWRGELGGEPTPELFVEHMVEVFRAVHRVLKDNGTCWINLGDSYVASATGGLSANPSKMTGGRNTQAAGSKRPDKIGFGLEAKQLIGIPWRVAFALQADGWYLRSDIIWAKPNPMPESVTDRPTKAHEYIFLLSKSPKYYYDSAAIREPAQDWGKRDRTNDKKNGQTGLEPHGGFKSENYAECGRNKRSVWTVNSQPCKEAHFATFPQKLIEPCILAGSAKGDTVLDPFFGSGTTGLVSRQLGRKCIGIDLNPDYLDIQQRRLNVEQGTIF